MTKEDWIKHLKEQKGILFEEDEKIPEDIKKQLLLEGLIIEEDCICLTKKAYLLY